ncbi:MAG TPA: RNase H family protein, partial [Acidimicrobiales bacterium]
MATVVYTDGACSGNPGPGGWAWAVGGGRFASGCEAHSTNQRMEIAAAFDAVRSLEGTLEVVSDSTYVVNCFRDRWWEGWLRRGWTNSQKKPVANRDLWEPFIDLVRTRGDVSFRWVKGHSGDPMNDLVDRLAVEAATTQHGRAGVGEPDDLGPADDPTPRWATEGEPVITGYPLVVFGHRPTELGGYDDNPLSRAVAGRLGEIIEAKASLADDLVVVSGLRLGAEMLGAEAALAVGIPLVAVLPYPDPESVWPAASQQRFRALRDQAR